ncbi:MAG: flagellar biosynthesis protein [Planctomycetota bacterium]|jgi:flagellar biosynthesis protein
MTSESQPEEWLFQAVALRYDQDGGSAPRVMAKGAGDTAEKILAVAEEHGVAISEDPDLVALLSTCDMGTEIPEDMYSAVAELLSWLYGVNSSLKG